MPYKDKEAGKKHKREYYQKNREKFIQKGKEIYLKNRDAIISYQKKYYIINKEKIKKYKTKYYHLNKDKITQYHKNYRKLHYQDIIIPRKIRNREKIRATMRKYRAERIKRDPQYRLSINLRNRLRMVLLGKQRAGSAVRDLGCTTSELKKHLENKFSKGMSWDNYGRGGWEVDHIKQLKEFDLTNREQFLEAVNFNNLQPLWQKDNLAKRFS